MSHRYVMPDRGTFIRNFVKVGGFNMDPSMAVHVYEAIAKVWFRPGQDREMFIADLYVSNNFANSPKFKITWKDRDGDIINHMYEIDLETFEISDIPEKDWV